jgi:hypothetical protein
MTQTQIPALLIPHCIKDAPQVTTHKVRCNQPLHQLQGLSLHCSVKINVPVVMLVAKFAPMINPFPM